MKNTGRITNQTLINSLPLILLINLRLYTESAYITDSQLVQNIVWLIGSAIASGFIVIGWLGQPPFPIKIRRPGLIALLIAAVLFLIRMAVSLVAGAAISVRDSIMILLHGLDFFGEDTDDELEYAKENNHRF